MRKAGLGLPLVLLGCSTTPQEAERAAVARADVESDLRRELAGLTPGERSACFPIPGRQQTRSQVYGSTILYRVSRDYKITNETTGGCERAGRANDTLVTVSPSPRLCRGDIVQTVDRVTGFMTGGCALGDFVTYRRQR